MTEEPNVQSDVEHEAADLAHEAADLTHEDTDSAASVAHHDPVTHMDAHSAISDDDHGHAEERLGPIDWGAWAAALIGAAAALLVVATFWIAVF